jgi:hypothetical protein
MITDDDVNRSEFAAAAHTTPQPPSEPISCSSLRTFPNSSRPVKDYLQGLFGELLSILRKERPNITAEANDEDLRAMINWHQLGVLPKLPERLTKKPWKEDICQWLQKQMYRRNRADELLGILQTVQRHKNSVGSLIVSVDRAMKRLLKDILTDVDIHSETFARRNMNQSKLLLHFINYVDGARSLDRMKDWLIRNNVYAADKFIEAIVDARKGNWNINSTAGIEDLKYRLWGLTTIRRDAFTRRF